MNATAAVFAILVTIYFWWENIKGISGIERKSSAHHVRDHGDGGHHDRLVRLYAVDAEALICRPCPRCAILRFRRMR